MRDKNTATKNVDMYIEEFPVQTQNLLKQLRATILKAVPKAEESISYMMPAYKYNGVLVYFAGYKKHIGFYPTAMGIETFKDELSAYKISKGTVQFPLDEPLPLKLIIKVVSYRANENLKKVGLVVNKKKG